MVEIAEETVVTSAPTRSDRIALPALIAASGISALGNGLTMVAVPWFVLVTTGSAARTGLAGAATAVAFVIAGIFGGTLVDRLGFKQASIISDLASGVTIALVPTLYFLDSLSFWVLLLLVFLGAVLDAPGNAARRAMLPGLVKRAGSTLERANSAMQFAQLTTGDLLAPMLAGILIGLIGAASILFIDAGTFALSLLIVAIAIRNPPRSAGSAGSEITDAESTGSSYFSELRQGLRFVLDDSFLSVIIPMSVVINFLVSPLSVVALPVLANGTFESPRALGIMLAGFGAGAAVGTIAYGALGHLVRRYTVYWAAIAGISGGLWLLTMATEVWIATVATVLIGLSAGPVNAAGAVIMQLRVPERIMGRVLGFLYASSSLATPLGLVVGGVVVEWFGVTTAFVASSIGVTACAFWVRLSPALRAVAGELEEGR